VSAANADNVRLVRRYLKRLRDVEGLCEKSIDNAARIIAEFEAFTGGRGFKCFRGEDAKRFEKKLFEKGGRRAAELSSRSTVHTKLQTMRKFFRWVREQPGYKRISVDDVAHFGLSLRDARIATARREQPTPSLAQVLRVLRAMPAGTDIEKRDRALMACMAMTGIRVGAVISLRLRHIRADRLGIDQDARDMNVKFAKSFTSIFFPIAPDVLAMLTDYVDYVRDELGWSPDHPLFPRKRQDGGSFAVDGLDDVAWKTAGPVWDLFRASFAAAGVPYYTPHSLRRTLTLAVLRVAQDPEMIKILSQNLGHEGILVTLASYGHVPLQRQAERIGALELTPDDRSEAEALADLQRALAVPAIAKLIKKIQDPDS
jgi:integrase